MEEKSCPQCLRQIAGKSRMYKDEVCGHSKCKLCLLQEEDECKQCIQSHAEVVDDHNYSNEKSLVVIEVFDDGKFETLSEHYDDTEETEEEKVQYIEEEYLDTQTEYDYDKESKDMDEEAKPEQPVKSLKKDRSIPHFVESITVNDEETGDPEHRYRCNICLKVFKSFHQIRYHKYCDESVEKPHKCDECGMRYRTSYQLKQHKQLHVNATYECMECNKTFKHDASAKKHLKKHFLTTQISAKKPLRKGVFPCSICEKVFSRNDYLKKHMICHEDNKRYKCDYCDKIYARNNALKFHVLTAHTERQEYKCKCGKVMTSLQSLARHQMVHSTSKPLKCLVCGLRSSRKDNLFRHIRSFHSDADPKTSIGVEDNTDVEDSLVEEEVTTKDEHTSVIRSQGNTLRKNVIVMKEEKSDTSEANPDKTKSSIPIENIEIYRKILSLTQVEEPQEEPENEIQVVYA